MRIGYCLASEEFGPARLVEQGRRAEEAGFAGLWISDHYHPWSEAQGHSPFVWATIGAIAQATRRISVTTAVTCPTVRIHPAIVAHAAATCAVLLEGRFALGVGSGEALNEHILGDPWPEIAVRLEMLEEAVEVIRLLWQGGMRSHHGKHYRVENARIYTLPEKPPAILISGFGPKATRLAARLGDGYCLTSASADLIQLFRATGGAEKVVQASVKVCYGPDEFEARRTAMRLWANAALPGELGQILPTPAHFEQACGLVSELAVAEAIPCGPDLDSHLALFDSYERAGVDELYVQQIGPDNREFFEVYAREVIPRFNR